MDIGGGIIFDDDTNLSWLKNANTAATNQFGLTQSVGMFPAAGEIGSTGRMNFATANNWITAMNAATYLGFNDWRLPTTTQPDASCETQNTNGVPGQGGGMDCTGSEMGHLFNVEFIMAVAPSPFDNVQDDVYWSGMLFAPNPNNVWGLSFEDGDQDAGVKDFNDFAWAVRSGDVSAPIIPEPATGVWMGTGLGGLLLLALPVRRTR